MKNTVISKYVHGRRFKRVKLSAGVFLNFLIFSQDIRALQEARTATEPAGEIRGGLHE